LLKETPEPVEEDHGGDQEPTQGFSYSKEEEEEEEEEIDEHCHMYEV
jgi:hypothetical protein